MTPCRASYPRGPGASYPNNRQGPALAQQSPRPRGLVTPGNHRNHQGPGGLVTPGISKKSLLCTEPNRFRAQQGAGRRFPKARRGRVYCPIRHYLGYFCWCIRAAGRLVLCIFCMVCLAPCFAHSAFLHQAKPGFRGWLRLPYLKAHRKTSDTNTPNGALGRGVYSCDWDVSHQLVNGLFVSVVSVSETLAGCWPPLRTAVARASNSSSSPARASGCCLRTSAPTAGSSYSHNSTRLLLDVLLASNAGHHSNRAQAANCVFPEDSSRLEPRPPNYRRPVAIGDEGAAGRYGIGGGGVPSSVRLRCHSESGIGLCSR